MRICTGSFAFPRSENYVIFQVHLVLRYDDHTRGNVSLSFCVETYVSLR